MDFLLSGAFTDWTEAPGGDTGKLFLHNVGPLKAAYMLMMLQCLLVRVTLAAAHLTGLCQVTPSTPLSVLEVRVDLLQTFHTG